MKYAATLSGEQTTITPVDGYFTVPGDGYVFVTGGNDTDTEIWMTWSDWTEEANSGTFAAYSQTTIDLSGVMANFSAGLMRIGNYYDEINFIKWNEDSLVCDTGRFKKSDLFRCIEELQIS